MELMLTPLKKEEIKTVFDEKAVEIINYYLKLNSFSHPESKKEQEDLKFQIAKENMEQWVVQALDGEPMGAGSYPVDIKTDSFMADIKAMSIKVDNHGNIINKDSGETSLAQKFQANGELDSLFVNKRFSEIKDLWIDILKSKYLKVIEENNLNTIYYIFLMRAENKYFLFMTKLNYNNIQKGLITVDENRSTINSVYLKNVIDDNFGNVKIYKAKKRMELRLHPKFFVENDYCIEFTPLVYPDKINMRDVDIKEHINNKINKFFR